MVRLVVTALAVVALGGTGCDSDGGAEPEQQTQWTQQVRPIMQRLSCGPGCHVTNGTGEGAWMSDPAELDKAIAAPTMCPNSTTLPECMLERIENGTMPSGISCPPGTTKPECATEAEKATIQAWIDAGAPH